MQNIIIDEDFTALLQGIYVRKPSEAQVIEGIKMINRLFARATNEINSIIKNYKDFDEKVEYKIALRAFIDTLEGMYKTL